MINEYDKNPTNTPDTSSSTAPNNETVLGILNGLIQTCKDGQEGFKEAAEGVERSDLKSIFYELSQQRSQFAGELQTLVRQLGGEPETGGSFSGSIHRGWINIKSAVTGKDDGAILNECERGEDSAKNTYKDAFDESLPDFVTETIKTQFSQVKSAHDRIKALRDAANDKSNTASSSY